MMQHLKHLNSQFLDLYDFLNHYSGKISFLLLLFHTVADFKDFSIGVTQIFYSVYKMYRLFAFQSRFLTLLSKISKKYKEI